MKTQQKSVTDLIPYVNNARTHSDGQITQIAASIKEFGFTNPVLIDKDDGIIAGHGRVEAAKKLGIDKVPTICLDHLSESQKKAYILADNRLALNAGWDSELLKIELTDLDDNDFDLTLTGFTDDELAEYLQTDAEGLTDEDDTPEMPAEPEAKLGDVYVLGGHRLMCGDSTSADDVGKLLDGVVPHLMVTDPPYGVEYDANWRNEAEIKIEGMGSRKVGARAVGKVDNDDVCDWAEAWSLFPGEVCYVWHAGVNSQVVAESLIKNDFKIRSQIIWAKNNFAISRGDYHWQHEPCFYAVKKNRKGHFAGGRKQTTIWNIDKPQKSETGHSTQKPVECMQRPIENNSSAGQAIYEPFSGSGTTILAAEKTGRKCLAMEISPAYVDVAIRRWEDFTGKKVELLKDD